MKKRLLAAAVAGAVMLSAGAQAQDTAAPEGYQLQQVLIMSRHNLRAPLANNGSVLEQSTAKAWPQWDVPGGQLTTKGGVLEVYMGHYMREWLAQQKLVTSGECPPENAVYAYANSRSTPSPPRSSLSPARSRTAASRCITSLRWAPWTRPSTRLLPTTPRRFSRKRCRRWKKSARECS